MPDATSVSTSLSLPRIDSDALTIDTHRLLGSGTFGKVFSGVLKDVGEVAVKIAHSTSNERKDLLRESSALFKHGGAHSNIVKWFGLYETQNRFGFVMEYMDCGSLDQLLLESQLKYTFDNVLSWLRQACDAVCYMHDMNIVHRDLKPLNMLLRGNYLILKLCDFGTVIDLRKTMTNCVGSAAYMAPEVFSGKKYGPECDVYSMGIIIWQMVARQAPYQRADKIALLWNVHQGHRPQELRCHWMLKKVINKCWDMDPLKRPKMEHLLKFAEQMIIIYPNGNEPLQDSNHLAVDPKSTLRSERFSATRLPGHRRTRSDEATLLPQANTSPTTVVKKLDEMSASVSEARPRTDSSRSSTATPAGYKFKHSDEYVLSAHELLLKIPSELRPPLQVLDDEASEQAYNEHLAMCREWIDANTNAIELLKQKHSALYEFIRRVEIRKKKMKLENLQMLYNSAVQRMRDNIDETIL